MNEMEILRRAKTYMDQLAHGMDPISGEEMPEDSVLNQVRLARCFFYVSGILDQVIANGGAVGTVQKREFQISQQQRMQVLITQDPVTISDFIGRLFAAAGAPDMKKPVATQFTNWLAANGYLLTVPKENGGNQRIPSEQGRGIGIFSERRQGRDGVYEAIYYRETAQRFMMAHLDEILKKTQESDR